MSEQGSEVIKIDLPEEAPDPFAENIREARRMALAKLPNANSLVGHMQLTNASRNLSPSRLDWARGDCGDLTADDWLADFEEERDEERFRGEVEIIKEMLEFAEGNTDKAEVVVFKVGDKDFPEHRALLIMPEDKRIDSYDVPRTNGAKETFCI